MLDPSSEGRKLLQAGLAAVEKAFEELGEAELLLGRYGDRPMESVHHHAGVRDALRGVLPFVSAEAESELVSESMPAAL